MKTEEEKKKIVKEMSDAERREIAKSIGARLYRKKSGKIGLIRG